MPPVRAAREKQAGRLPCFTAIFFRHVDTSPRIHFVTCRLRQTFFFYKKFSFLLSVAVFNILKKEFQPSWYFFWDLDSVRVGLEPTVSLKCSLPPLSFVASSTAQTVI